MNDTNIADFIKTYLNIKEHGDKIEHKLIFKNSLLERLISKLLFEYNSSKNSPASYELEDILVLLKDGGKSTVEAEFVKEILKSHFNGNSLSFYEK